MRGYCVLVSYVLFCPLYLITDAAVIKLCETRSTSAGSDGVIITQPSVIGSQQGNCQLNLTDLAANSWIRFKIDLEEVILQRLCKSEIPLLRCPGFNDRDCNDGVVICYISREKSFPQSISITVPEKLVNLEGLTMSYKVAQVIQHSSEEDNDYITDEISEEYGYIVSHREFNRDKYEGNQDSTVTLRMNLTCVPKPVLLTLAVLSWDIRGCDRDFLEINSVKICNNNATIGMMHEASPAQHDRLLQLQLRFQSDGEKGQGQGFLIRYRDQNCTLTFHDKAQDSFYCASNPGVSASSSEAITTCTSSAETSGKLGRNEETVKSLTAACIVLGLLLIVVAVVLLVLIIKRQRCRKCTASYGGESVHNEPHLSDAVAGGPSSSASVPSTSTKRAPPIGGNEYSEMDDSTLPDRGSYQEINKSHADHVYAGLDYYDVADDTELSPQGNQHEFSDDTATPGDPIAEKDNFYHTVEPSDPSEL